MNINILCAGYEYIRTLSIEIERNYFSNKKITTRIAKNEIPKCNKNKKKWETE